jgi:serine/threonine protein kinase
MKAKDLLKSLLVTDPKKRISSDKLLKHPWFTGNVSTKGLSGLQNNLKEFRASKKMKVVL